MRLSRSIVAAVALAAPAAWSAEVGVSPDRFEALERRNTELEIHNQDLESRLEALEQRERARAQSEEVQELGAPLAEWARRVRISGSANTGYYRGGDESPFEDTGFQVWDARFFLDADLGREVAVGDVTVARNVGFSFEWNLVRVGQQQADAASTQVGEIYIELQGLGGSSFANAQVGRFQIPVGENYLRFSKGARDNPFISNTAGGPWYWDDGVRLHGADADRRFGYVASISDGDTDFDADSSREPQLTLKLYANPTSWLHASVSALRGGETDNGALWLGETWATPVGELGSLPIYQDGTQVSDAAEGIDQNWLVAGDLVLSHDRFGRLWLAGGRYAIEAEDGGAYDRSLLYWIAEWMIGGGVLAPELTPFYLALRANGLGTYDDGEGYVLDIRDLGRFGYNAESLHDYSIALGWHLTRFATLRIEYTRRITELVNGVPDGMSQQAGPMNLFGVEFGAAF